MALQDRERWDSRYAAGSHTGGEGPGWLAALDDEIPREGHALDVACGVGRVALWLAQRGLRVTALDISPVGLDLARQAARLQGLQLEWREQDLEQGALPEGSFAAVACFHYLQRELFAAMAERLRPGGVLLCEIPTVRNAERHPHPAARFLIEPNELLRLCAPLEIVYYREGWMEDRCVARVLARKAGP